MCASHVHAHDEEEAWVPPTHTDDDDDIGNGDGGINLKDIFKFVLLKESYILLSDYFPSMGKRQSSAVWELPRTSLAPGHRQLLMSHKKATPSWSPGVPFDQGCRISKPNCIEQLSSQ